MKVAFILTTLLNEEINQSSIYIYIFFFSLVVESVVNPNHNPFTIPHDNDVFMLRDKERQKKKQVMSCNYS